MWPCSFCSSSTLECLDNQCCFFVFVFGDATCIAEHVHARVAFPMRLACNALQKLQSEPCLTGQYTHMTRLFGPDIIYLETEKKRTRD